MSNDIENVLELSDEEFNQRMSEFDTQADMALGGTSNDTEKEVQQKQEQGYEEESLDSGTETDDDSNDDFSDEEINEQTDDDEDLDEGPEGSESLDEGETNTSTDLDDSTAEEDATSDTNESNDDIVDYKAEYKRLLEPFKANGKTIKVNSADDARKLMQMGANYNYKMGNIKPYLKIVKTLEANNLLDEVKINHLIDVSKGNKGALGRLMKDTGVDTYDIGEEVTEAYKPTNHTISDKDYNLDEVLDSLRGTEGYEKTSKVLGEAWDNESRATMYENPSIIQTIHQHVQLGIYDKVQEKVDTMKMVGNIPSNVSDVDAYGTVFSQMLEQGELSAQQPQSANTNESTKKVVDTSRTKKRKAAAATKKRSADKRPKYSPEDILNMSDEEIENLSDSSLFKTI